MITPGDTAVKPVFKAPVLLQMQDYKFVQVNGDTYARLCNGGQYKVSDALATLRGTELLALYRDVDQSTYIEAQAGPRRGKVWRAPDDATMCSIDLADGIGPVMRVITTRGEVKLIPLE